MLISFHGKQEVKDYSPQDIIISCLENNFISANKNGNVFSRKINKKLGCISTKGYMVCTLHFNKIRKQCKIHQIVWIAYNGKIPSGYVIDHKNKNKLDNRLCNLRLANAKLNSNNRRDYCGKNNPSAKINKEIADNIRKQYSLNIFSYKDLACNFNISKTLVATIIRNESWI